MGQFFSSPKKVLIVSTSADKMGDHTTGAWSEEITGPYYVFKDAKCDVTVCSIGGGDIPVDAGSLSEQFKTENDKKMEAEGSGPLKGTPTLASLDVASFDIVFFAGGHGTCVDYPTDEVGAVVSKAAAAGKVVAAVCHGPMALVKAKAADGKPLVAGACRRQTPPRGLFPRPSTERSINVTAALSRHRALSLSLSCVLSRSLAASFARQVDGVLHRRRGGPGRADGEGSVPARDEDEGARRDRQGR